MPKITCTCGHVIGTGSFPNAGAYLLVSEKDYDELGQITAVEQLNQLLFLSSKLYKCPQCAELMVFWNGNDVPEYFKKN
jgi:hypothetical protein